MNTPHPNFQNSVVLYSTIFELPFLRSLLTGGSVNYNSSVRKFVMDCLMATFRPVASSVHYESYPEEGQSWNSGTMVTVDAIPTNSVDLFNNVLGDLIGNEVIETWQPFNNEAGCECAQHGGRECYVCSKNNEWFDIAEVITQNICSIAWNQQWLNDLNRRVPVDFSSRGGAILVTPLSSMTFRLDATMTQEQYRQSQFARGML